MDALLVREEGELLDFDSMDNSHEIDDTPVSCVDPGEQALGEFLDSTQGNDNNNTNTSAGEEDQFQTDNFIDELASLCEAEKHGPAVSEPVSKLFNNHLNRDFGAANSNNRNKFLQGGNSQTTLVINKFEKYPVPVNLQNIKSCRVNDGVFKAMNAPTKKSNSDLHHVEAAICKAVTAQARIFDKLASLKASVSDKSLKSEFNEVFSLMADSVEFCSFARTKTNDVRRTQILTSLNDNYKHLITETKAEEGLLFGSNLENAMKSVESTNRLSKKLCANQPNNNYNNNHFRNYNKPFLGQGRGRGRGKPRNHRYQPYQPRFQQYQTEYYSTLPQGIPSSTTLGKNNKG